MGLEVGITRAFAYVTQNGRATCELPASVGKGHCDDVAGSNRASAPVYGSLRRPRPARNRLDLHDADGSFPAISIPLVALILSRARSLIRNRVHLLTPCPNPDIA